MALTLLVNWHGATAPTKPRKKAKRIGKCSKLLAIFMMGIIKVLLISLKKSYNIFYQLTTFYCLLGDAVIFRIIDVIRYCSSSIFKPAFSIFFIVSRLTLAPDMRTVMGFIISSIFAAILLLLRMCSSITTFPSGFTTRRISCKPRIGFGTEQNTQVDTTTSNESSGKSI